MAKVEFSRTKQAILRKERDIDLADAHHVFAGRTATVPFRHHQRPDEQRFISAGWLDGRLVIMVWIERDNTRRVLSMRYADDDERKLWAKHMG